MDERLATNGVPGAALGVVTGNRLFTHAYGVAEVSSAEPVSPATPFRIASLTKVFTAAAVARLAHAGQIEVQQPVRAILPEFGVADAETGAAVTTAHLLSHSTGWADALEPDPAHAVIGLRNHGLTCTGDSLSEILDRIAPKVLRQVPMT